MTPYRVLVTGSRTWTDHRTITDRLDALYREHGDRLVIVHGACPQGADAMAAAWCRRHGVRQERHPAEWRAHGRAAGPLRNAAMVATRPDLCLAFIRDASPGATGCHTMARRAGIPTPNPIPPDHDIAEPSEPQEAGNENREPLPDRCKHGFPARYREDGQSTCALCRREGKTHIRLVS